MEWQSELRMGSPGEEDACKGEDGGMHKGIESLALRVSSPLTWLC